MYFFMKGIINMKKKLLIPVFLAALAVPLCFQQTAKGVNAVFFGQANSRADYIKYASQVGAQLADEGFVLLKNDGFLPMQTQGAKVSVAGKASSSILRGLSHSLGRDYKLGRGEY